MDICRGYTNYKANGPPHSTPSALQTQWGRPASQGRGREITAAEIFVQPGAQLGLQGRREGEEGAGHGGSRGAGVVHRRRRESAAQELDGTARAWITAIRTNLM